MLATASALEWTLALIAIFFVLFPVLGLGLVAFAVAQTLGERTQNQRFAGRWGRRAERRTKHR
jgi:cytochrome bd-type quinol oxidase subunit 1